MNQLILLPSAEHLRLLNVLSVVVLLIHLPYMAIIVGSTIFSIFFHIKDLIEPAERTKRFGRDILQIVPVNIPMFFMLGAIPLITLMLVYTEWFYQTNLPVVNYFGFIICTTIIGLLLTYYYHMLRKRSGNLSIFSLAVGLIGLGILVNAYYVFFGTLSIFVFPEYWGILDLPVPVIYSWNPVARFTMFLLSGFALTGLGILFYWFYWSPKQMDEAYSKFVKYFAIILAMVSIFILPLFIVWNVGTLPVGSLSLCLYTINIVAFLFLFIIGVRLYRLLTEPTLKIGSKSFVLFIIVMFLLICSDEVAKETMNLAHVNFISDKAELVKIALEEKRTAGMKVTVDLALGEKIYKTRCSTCHAFDHKVVGPPHNEVLPKYINDQDTLKKFILHPHKVNPAFPEMPPQPLNKKEVESVVAYMMKHIKEDPNVKK